jgi:hypothetical protein
MRWLSRDPLGEAAGAGQGTNLYGYVLGDPLGATDPLGLSCWRNLFEGNPVRNAPDDPLADALGLEPSLDDADADAAEEGEAFVGGAQSALAGPALAGQLSVEAASSAFTSEGTLTAEALAGSREIIPRSAIGNPNVPSGFSKFSTQTFQSPSGNYQVHFYMNSHTGEPYYQLDFKSVFNSGGGWSMKVLCTSLVPPLSWGSAESNGWLTIGKEYVVVSVYGRGNRLDYRIVGDDGFTPALQSASQFEILDEAIPDNWVFRQFSDSEWVIMPTALAAEGFWEAYFDGDVSARAAFDQVISTIVTKSGES